MDKTTDTPMTDAMDQQSYANAMDRCGHMRNHAQGVERSLDASRAREETKDVRIKSLETACEQTRKELCKCDDENTALSVENAKLQRMVDVLCDRAADEKCDYCEVAYADLFSDCSRAKDGTKTCAMIIREWAENKTNEVMK